MTLNAEETPLGALARGLESATDAERAEVGLADDAAKDQLLADARKLGLVGTITLLAATAPGDPAVAAEAPARVREELAKSLGDGASGSLKELLASYVAKKGAHGADLARRLVGRTIHEFYEIDAFGLTADDTLRALDLIERSAGDRDARDLARALVRVSKIGARTVLGHLEGQLNLVHRVRTEEVMPSELDTPILEFAPRIFGLRMASMWKGLIVEEARVRLSCVLWGRLRGLVFTRDALLKALDGYLPEKPFTLARLLARPDVAERRRALVAAEASLGDAHVVELASADANAFTPHVAR